MTHRTITKGRFCLTFIRNSAAKQLGIGFGFRRGKGKIAEHHAACNQAREQKTAYPKRDEALQIYFDSTTWDGLKDRAIRETQGRIDALVGDLKLSNDRFAGWKQTHTHFDPVDKFWVSVK
jgi:hypothetical protein